MSALQLIGVTDSQMQLYLYRASWPFPLKSFLERQNSGIAAAVTSVHFIAPLIVEHLEHPFQEQSGPSFKADSWRDKIGL